MKDRTLVILQALIQEFIETANPVASKTLLEHYDFDLSSATIRNEFARLEEVGLIAAPHVSSGKIPTQKGYRLFVDQMLDTQPEVKIESMFDKYASAYQEAKSKESLFDVLRLISQLSGNVTFGSVSNDETFYLGLSNVLRSPEFLADPEKAAKIFEVFEGRSRLQRLLGNLELPKGEVKIFIGEENLLEEISSCAMLVVYFQTPHLSGHLGILGPMRMNYNLNKSLLEQTLKMLL